MSDEFSNLWTSQATSGKAPSKADFQRRLARSRSRAWRKHYFVLASLLLGFASAIAFVLFFDTHPDAMIWLAALYCLAWAVRCWYSPADWWVVKNESPLVNREFISLNLESPATPCLDFYRRELKGHYDTVRHGRRIVLATAFGGLGLLALALVSWGVSPFFEVFGFVGGVLAIGGFWRHAILRRESPDVSAELRDAETLWPD